VPVEFENLLKQKIFAVHHDFHWLLVATKLLTAKLHSRYVKEPESMSEVLERSELELKSDILLPTPLVVTPSLSRTTNKKPLYKE